MQRAKRVEILNNLTDIATDITAHIGTIGQADITEKP